MKVVEMFSGIGSQAKALSRISKAKGIEFNVLKTCEWNVHAFVAYNFIHNSNRVLGHIKKMTKLELIEALSQYSISFNGINEIPKNRLANYGEDILKIIYNSILRNNNLVDIKKVKGKDIPDDTDLLTYSFPCQDLSNVGSFHGYKHGIDRDKNTRSGLLWEVERILEEKRIENVRLPKFLLLENVTALVAQRHNTNFEEWKQKLKTLGYENRVFKLNSLDFGIPQNRNRLIMLSVYVDENELLRTQLKEYWNTHDLNDKKYIQELPIIQKPLASFLKLNYKKNPYFSEALLSQPNNTKSRLKIWEQNSKIVDENYVYNEKVQTITTKQDRHPNSGNIYFDYELNTKSKFRFLTPRECFLLMGFDEKDYECLVKNNFVMPNKSWFFSRDVLYKLAGNSIVVDVLEQVFNQILDIDEMLNNYNR